MDAAGGMGAVREAGKVAARGVEAAAQSRHAAIAAASRALAPHPGLRIIRA